MRWVVLAASAAIAVTLCLPGEAAQPAAPAASGDTVNFEQYRDWRLNFIERRQTEIAVELAAVDLPAPQKARLLQSKAYFDWFASLPAADRDRRFRERFNRIDANRDGQLDPDERGVWRDKQRAFYNRDRTAPQASAEATVR